MSKEEEIKAGSEEKGTQAGGKPSAPQADKPKTNTVPVDREQLAQILRDNEEFRTKIGQLESNAVSTQTANPFMVSKKEKSVTRNLRKWNDEYVVGWVNKATRPGKFTYTYNETDPKTGITKQFIDVILHGKEDKPVKLEYLPYLQDSIIVPLKQIKASKEEDEVIYYGVTYKKDFVENGYGMYETTVQVRMDETREHYTFILELENGEELTISDRFVG